VLEPLGAYLHLAAQLHQLASAESPLCSAFNFGPDSESNRTVEELVAELLKHWPGKWEDQSDPRAPHEAKLLQLSIDKARALLRWAPAWDFATAVKETTRWYRAVSVNSSISAAQVADLTTGQIRNYAAASGLA
jgi:CDP-glucose 4,6-dehydratase